MRCYKKIVVNLKQNVAMVCALILCYYTLLGNNRGERASRGVLEGGGKEARRGLQVALEQEVALERQYRNSTLRQYYLSQADSQANNQTSGDDTARIHVVLTSCEHQPIRDTQTMLTSLLLNNPRGLHLHVLASGRQRFAVSVLLAKARHTGSFHFNYTFYNRQSLGNGSEAERAADDSSVRSCEAAAQLVHVPWLLPPYVHRVIHVQSNALVLGDLQPLWDNFKHFNRSQWVGVARSDLDSSTANLPLSAHLPLSEHVTLLDLAKLRAHDWRAEMTPLLRNVTAASPPRAPPPLTRYLTRHRETVYEISCRYSFRAEYCRDPRACEEAARGRVVILADSPASHSTQYFSKYVYEAYSAVTLGEHSEEDVLELIRELWHYHEHAHCRSPPTLFTDNSSRS